MDCFTRAHLVSRLEQLGVVRPSRDIFPDLSAAYSEVGRHYHTARHVDRRRIERVHALIMATRHDAAVEDPDQQLLVDIDLGILGQQRAVFDEYDAAIRREYHWVPWHRYVEARVAVLTAFLDRAHIYSTPPLRENLETRARLNIAHAIETLNSQR